MKVPIDIGKKQMSCINMFHNDRNIRNIKISVIVYVSLQFKMKTSEEIKNISNYTVEPVLRDHLWDQEKVAWYEVQFICV